MEEKRAPINEKRRLFRDFQMKATVGVDDIESRVRSWPWEPPPVT